MFKEQFQKVGTEVTKLSLALQAHLADESIPLDDRWDLFIETPSYLLKHVNCFSGSVLNIDLYDDYGIEKYQTITVVHLVECLEDHDDGKVREVKEYFLERGAGSFTYDW